MALTALLASPALAQDVLDAAAGTGNLSKFVETVEVAGLTETLNGVGPFTVFAPNDNDAFAEIEEGGELEQLKMELPRLTALLSYHVVPGKIMSTDLTEGMTLTIPEGDEITITLAGGAKVNDANIVAADIEASNGVVHVIDAILTLPE